MSLSLIVLGFSILIVEDSYGTTYLRSCPSNIFFIKLFRPLILSYNNNNNNNWKI